MNLDILIACHCLTYHFERPFQVGPASLLYQKNSKAFKGLQNTDGSISGEPFPARLEHTEIFYRKYSVDELQY